MNEQIKDLIERYLLDTEVCDYLESQKAEIDRLKQAIRTTLDNNRHLADGEDCTLIDLKRAMKGEWQ